MKKYLCLIICFCLYNISFLNGQIITTIAGDGTIASTGDYGLATASQVAAPAFGSFDSLGNFYFGDLASGAKIRKITPFGIITTVAGSSSSGFSGDGGSATLARLSDGRANVDAAGNIYIADFYNYRVRKVDVSTGIIHTIAGNGTPTSTGDGGPAVAATLRPIDVCADGFGNVFISDEILFTGGGKIRRIDAVTGIITTIALVNPQGMQFDATGSLYVGAGARVLKVDTATGTLDTIAGTGLTGPFNGDGIPATNANFTVFDIALDASNNVYVADHGHERVRKITPGGIISTIAGTGTGAYSGDGFPATSADIYNPEGVAIDECGNVYISASGNNRIRKVTYTTSPLVTIDASPNDTVCSGNPVTYTTSTVGIGAPAYQWYVNGSPVSGTGSTFTYSPATGDTVYCKLTGTATCSGNTVTRFSNGIKMVVNPTTPASLSLIVSPNDTVCTGTAVTCAAAITGGGATPAYHWYVNGSPVTATTAYTFSPVTGDSVSCVMVSSATCPVPDDTLESHLRLTVLPYVTPSVSITSSISSEGFTCAGDTVTFVATAISGGATPGYQWKKNGVNVGTGSSSYIYSPADGDTVRCVLTSSGMCSTVPTAISNNVGPIAVMPLILPSISLTASATFEIGETVTVNATVTGTSSYNIKWFKNTSLVATTSTPVFTYTKTAGIDIITAMVIHSGSGCYDSATSAPISVAAPNLVETLQQPSEFSIYPNPAHDELTISGAASINTVAITNLLGQSYYNVITSTHKNQLVINVGQLPVGVYVLRVNGVYFRRFVRQ